MKNSRDLLFDKAFFLSVLLLGLVTHLTSLRLSASFGMSVMSSYQE